jgi:tripartite-type tricarboxylate transporter receptor subunit TctC
MTSLLKHAAAAFFSMVLPVLAQGQTYPARTITLVVPYAAGGPVDIAGRSIAEALSGPLGQQVIVENKAGAGGTTGTKFVAGASPDGYTILLGSTGPLVIAPAANPGQIDVSKVFQIIGLVADSPQLLVVNAKLPIRSLSEFVDYARARPDGLNYGSAGIGTTPHLSSELLHRAANIKLVHVPYRGTSAAIPDLVSGELQFLFGDTVTLKPFVESGAVRALAVTGAQRSKLAPAIPTTAEAGYPALLVRNFYAVLTPAGIPEAIASRLADAIAAAKADKAFSERMERQGMEVVPGSQVQAQSYLREEVEKWTPIIKAMGLKLN